MATGTLIRGIRTVNDAGAETFHRDYELREAGAGDIIDALIESEQIIVLPGDRPEPHLVISPTRVGLNTLRRQIVRIGTLQGPFDLAELRKLSPADLQQLQNEAELLEALSLQKVSDRGRTEGGG